MNLAGGLLGLLLATQTTRPSQVALFKATAVQLLAEAASLRAQPIAVASGDWNADSHTDLAVADSIGSRVSVVLGDGAGAFLQAENFVVGASPIALVAEDLNFDGATDLIVLNRDSRSVTVLAGNATTFTLARTIPLGGSGTLIALAVGLFDGEVFRTSRLPRQAPPPSRYFTAMRRLVLFRAD